jgi:hypothetical protein
MPCVSVEIKNRFSVIQLIILRYVYSLYRIMNILNEVRYLLQSQHDCSTIKNNRRYVYIRHQRSIS